MKNKILNILIIFLLLFTSFKGVSASEIFGNISTNMNYHDGDGADLPIQEDDSDSELVNNSSSGNIIFRFNNQGEKEKEIKVLGLSQYADGTLVRGEDQRIYIIYGQFKNYISSLAKLQRYAGQVIYNISDEDLEQYQTRDYIDGDLIREKGDAKVFVIMSGQLKHILNLEELRVNFKGEEIFNLNGEEMGFYY